MTQRCDKHRKEMREQRPGSVASDVTSCTDDLDEPMDGLLRAARAVVQAINDEGVNPPYHRDVMRRHCQEWPMLWRALNDLIREVDRL